MNFITIKYEIDSELVDDPNNEQLFTLTFLKKLKVVYDRILEHLTPTEIKIVRNSKNPNKITVHVICNISIKKLDDGIDDLIRKALQNDQ